MQIRVDGDVHAGELGVPNKGQAHVAYCHDSGLWVVPLRLRRRAGQRMPVAFKLCGFDEGFTIKFMPDLC